MGILVPELMYRSGRLRAGEAVAFENGSGRIKWVGPLDELPSEHAARDCGERVQLPGRALLPGFVNAHSHAFQRLIRGRTQWRRASDPPGTFWSWRRAMYEVVSALTPAEVTASARLCFLEMARAGMTSVGEFHYLHNAPDGSAYADPNELAVRVIEAAEEVGIRIRLLNVCYARGGIDRPLTAAQRRFATPTLDGYLRATEELAGRFAGNELVSVGVAPHSVRAVPREWLPELHRAALRAGVPLHMHVAEQPAEIAECRLAYGLSPVELLAEDGVMDEWFTAVHATHLAQHEVAALGTARATVCACPTTERDLGDGFLPATELDRSGVPIAIGSDSQTIIDAFEELRLIEYHERLCTLQRVVLSAEDGEGCAHVAPRLLTMGTQAGAGALKIDAGRLEAGALADMCAVDLGHLVLAGWTPETLPAMLVLSASASVVTDVWVGGERIVRDRAHVLDETALDAYRTVGAAQGSSPAITVPGSSRT